MKDPNNPKNILIDEDVVDTIKLIFKLYIDGLGCNKIAHYLNEQKIETPAVHKNKKFGFGWKPDWTNMDLWYDNLDWVFTGNAGNPYTKTDDSYQYDVIVKPNKDIECYKTNLDSSKRSKISKYCIKCINENDFVKNLSEVVGGLN